MLGAGTSLNQNFSIFTCKSLQNGPKRPFGGDFWQFCCFQSHFELFLPFLNELWANLSATFAFFAVLDASEVIFVIFCYFPTFLKQILLLSGPFEAVFGLFYCFTTFLKHFFCSQAPLKASRSTFKHFSSLQDPLDPFPCSKPAPRASPARQKPHKGLEFDPHYARPSKTSIERPIKHSFNCHQTISHFTYIADPSPCCFRWRQTHTRGRRRANRTNFTCAPSVFFFQNFSLLRFPLFVERQKKKFFFVPLLPVYLSAACSRCFSVSLWGDWITIRGFCSERNSVC